MSVLLRLLSLAALLACPSPGRADLVSPYGGETAPNFVEISVLSDRVRIALEIDPADYPLFVSTDGPALSLAARTGGTLVIEADRTRLVPTSRKVELRPRAPRVSAATTIYPARPKSAQVIYAELEFPFAGQPRSFTFKPPLDADGMPTASLGVLIEHLGVPVTDYRYLSRAETLVPDWTDPWFSVFENPNLTRHHRSPLMSFISVEPREVRNEIILRLHDLEGWIDLGLDSADTVGAAQLAIIEPAVAEFLRDRNPMVIDGEELRPAEIRLSQVKIGAEGLRLLDDDETSDRATSLLGVILSYPREALAREVEMTWDLFPTGSDVVPVTLTDPAGGVPVVARPDDPVVRWINHLTNWVEPQASPVSLSTARVISLPLLALLLVATAVIAALRGYRNRGKRRYVGLSVAALALIAAVASVPVTTQVSLPGQPAPDAEMARQLLSRFLENVGTAMLETRPETFAAALSPFVASDRVSDVATELRRGLSVTLPSGALARVDEINELQVEQISPDRSGSGSQILATWTAALSGGHWGHMHRRLVTYRALVDLSRKDNRWFLSDLTILSAQSKA
ncbi:hypothetical protein [Alloyangia pacifica]|uniref:hypothetical protein n=1 Tax=Alloyangia pacifica TaxID=311180 RepID=UPI001CFD49B7|nr:hypothetical protein [Alloyangia pacifica]